MLLQLVLGWGYTKVVGLLLMRGDIDVNVTGLSRHCTMYSYLKKTYFNSQGLLVCSDIDVNVNIKGQHLVYSGL